MSELKAEIINKLNSIDDAYIFEELKVFLDFELGVEEYVLTKHQHARIMEAKAEYLSSDVLVHSIADLEIEKWLDGK
jgi:hypothetical protein